MTTPNRYHSATEAAAQDPGRLLRFAIMLAGGLTLALALANPGHADENHGHSSEDNHAHAAHGDAEHAARGDGDHAHGSDDHVADGDDGHGEGGHAHGDGGHGRKAPKEWAERQSPLEPDADTLAQGMHVYQRYCSACHGPRGGGNGLAPAAAYYDPSPTNLALHGAAHAAGEYAWLIKEGNNASAMPRFQDKLTEDDIWSVVLYIRHRLADEQVAEHKH